MKSKLCFLYYNKGDEYGNRRVVQELRNFSFSVFVVVVVVLAISKMTTTMASSTWFNYDAMDEWIRRASLLDAQHGDQLASVHPPHV